MRDRSKKYLQKTGKTREAPEKEKYRGATKYCTLNTQSIL